MKFGFENEEIMGKRVTEIPYRQLVKLGAVTPYEVLVLKVNSSDIKQFISTNTWVRDFNFMDNEEFQSRFIASIIAIEKAVRKGLSKRILTFHSRISHSQNANKAIDDLAKTEIFKSFNKFGFTGYCQGSQATTNKKKLDYLAESEYALISNARVLTEGVSVKEIDTVVFFDPKTSAADVQQAFSRAIRLNKGKDIARVIIPVIYNDDNTIDAPQFQHMINILDYLGEQDSVLEEEIRYQAQSNRVRRNSSRIINTDELEIDGVDVTEFFDELDLMMYSRYKAKNGYWTRERLIEFVADKTTRNQLLIEDGALNALEANDYELWKELASHIPLPNKGLSEEECAEKCLGFEGSYSDFKADNPEIISRFSAIANLKSNDYKTGADLIAKYCSHMTRGRIQYKSISAEDLMSMLIGKNKKQIRLEFPPSLPKNLKKYPHLKEVAEYYDSLPNAKTGMKTGQKLK